MVLRRLLQCLLLPCLLHCGSERSSGADSIRRVAVLPAFMDFEIQSNWREALSGFDARLQAELLKGWQTEVLSRAGLSTVVFEQKLRLATDQKAPLYRVLPADVVVLPVFDWHSHDLRLYIAPIGPSMTVGQPVLLKAKSPKDLADTLPGEAARVLARIGKLAVREPEAAGAKTDEAQPAERLVCALLDPISPEGRQNAAAVAAAPFIRAGLDQAVASGSGGGVRLVERNEIARLIEEKALNAAFGSGLEANAAAQFGRMLKADLILVPFVHPAGPNKQVEIDWFALEVSTGRLLECVSWASAPGEPLPVGTMTAFLAKASARARELARRATPDDANARHHEAAFLMSLPEQWDGLRMDYWSTLLPLQLRIIDAALALNSDEPALVEKTLGLMRIPDSDFPERRKYFPHSEWSHEMGRLEKTGQMEVMRSAARRVFELPLLELQRQPSPNRTRYLAFYWNRMGEYQKALDCLTAGGKQEGNLGDKLFYDEAALAFMGLRRYKECAETVLRQETFTRHAMWLAADAYRALGNEKEEFNLLLRNIRALDRELDRYVRVLDLAVKLGRTDDVLRSYGVRNYWEFRAEPFVIVAGVRARLAAGQKEIAASEAQCALINARKQHDGPVIKELEKILADLGEKPLDHLLRAGDFVKLPQDCVIHLLHDQTIDAGHARAVAEHVAGFWGCPVQLWPVKLEARKLSFYKPLGQTLECRKLIGILMEAGLPSQRYLGRAFLTREKMNSLGGNGVWGDLWHQATPQLSLVSDHFLEKSRQFPKLESRPLPLLDAIAVSTFASVENVLWSRSRSGEGSANGFNPVPPDLFSLSGHLYLDDHELGISQRTAAALAEITWDEIAAAITENHDLNYYPKDAAIDPKDRPIVEDLSRQLRGMKPETVLPPGLPNPTTENAPDR